MCLGNHYIPGFGYVCSDCNRVVGMSKKNLEVVQTNIQDRFQEHKKRLQELRARDDPVLLASPIFASPIWCKRFNVKPCHIPLTPIDPTIIEIYSKRPKVVRVQKKRRRPASTCFPKVKKRKFVQKGVLKDSTALNSTVTSVCKSLDIWSCSELFIYSI